MSVTIRVVIVEDHKLFREALRLFLANDKHIQIVGEAENGHQAIDMIEDLNPDIVLLDIKMPELGGFQVLQKLQHKCNRTKALMLTAAMDEDSIINSLISGARGYLTKNASPSNLIKAIKAVHEGQLWVERNLFAKLLDKSKVENEAEKLKQQDADVDLTQREQEVLKLLSKGLSNNKIADHLYISEKTVKSHLNRIFKKLDVNRRLEAILYAIKFGLN